MKPTLFIICGNIGVGKTTTAKALNKLLKIPSISVDTTIHQVFEKPSNLGRDTPFNDFELNVCYNIFALVAEHMLLSGKSIIIDGAFAKKEQRDLLMSVAKKMKSKHYILYVTCPNDIVKKRSSKRFVDGQGVGWKAHMKLKKTYEPIETKYTEINSSENIPNQLKSFLQKNKIA